MRAIRGADATDLDAILQPLDLGEREHHAVAVPLIVYAQTLHQQLQGIDRADADSRPLIVVLD
jgi:hypothetical protein